MLLRRGGGASAQPLLPGGQASAVKSAGKEAGAWFEAADRMRSRPCGGCLDVRRLPRRWCPSLTLGAPSAVQPTIGLHHAYRCRQVEDTLHRRRAERAQQRRGALGSGHAA